MSIQIIWSCIDCGVGGMTGGIATSAMRKEGTERSVTARSGPPFRDPDRISQPDCETIHGGILLELHQYRYNRDNFGYLLVSDGACLVIDGGAVDEMVAEIERRTLSVVGITNTHGHGDHTQGNAGLEARLGAPLLPHEALAAKGEVSVGGAVVSVFPTPGHTVDSVTFHHGDVLVTGDTLFNGTVGNCFSGDLEAFYRSIKRLMAFPPETRIFAGHDYVSLSIGFARSIEPENPFLEAVAANHDPERVVSTLADEMRINPYLRFNDPKMIAIMDARGLKTDTEYQRWLSLMEVY